MKRIIILEGPDAAGKTSLANVLSLKLDRPMVIHMGPPKPGEDVLHTYAMQLFMASKYDGDTVFDRLFQGERVYGPIYRKYDLLGEEGEILLQRMATGYGAVQILCLPPFTQAVTKWKERSSREMVTNLETYTRIYDSYHKVFRHVHFDYTDQHSVERTYRRALRENTRLPMGMIGSLNPKFIFLGERANHRDLDAPFISLTGSSHFLFHALLDAGFEEHEMAFANAQALDNRMVRLDLVKEWICELGARIICLGSAARRSVKTIQAFGVPHPAYWKRFHFWERQKYVNMLREIRELHVH